MSMAPRGRAWLLAWCAACALLTACSTPTPVPPSPPLPSTPSAPPTTTVPVPVPVPTAWSGRLSLSIQKDFSQQTHIHIAFELEGNAEEGQLQVEGPFGTAAIVLRWRPGQAILSQGERSYRFASLPDLIQRSIGTDLPIEAVFAWLRNESVEVPGWQVESKPSQGGPLVARRYEPWPRLELRVVLQP
jgi:outer membrane lipoprotein LolB